MNISLVMLMPEIPYLQKGKALYVRLLAFAGAVVLSCGSFMNTERSYFAGKIQAPRFRRHTATSLFRNVYGIYGIS
jgi:hypothetical protein